MSVLHVLELFKADYTPVLYVFSTVTGDIGSEESGEYGIGKLFIILIAFFDCTRLELTK